jgi:hypothetical protein
LFAKLKKITPLCIIGNLIDTKRNMKNTTNYPLSVLLILISSLWLSGCWHIDELDFETENKFYLSALSYEFDVKTKQDCPALHMIYIDGQEFWLSTVNIMPDTTIYHNDYSVKYVKGSPQEVIGKWFAIKPIDDYTIHISIDENNSDKDRSLDIQLGWRNAINFINIKQSKK